MAKTSTTTNELGAAAANARRRIDTVAEATTDAVESVKASMHGAVDSVADKATAASQWASETLDTAKQAPSDLIETGAEYIRSRPYAAVGVALCIGFVIGKLR